MTYVATAGLEPCFLASEVKVPVVETEVSESEACAVYWVAPATLDLLDLLGTCQRWQERGHTLYWDLFVLQGSV